VLVVLVGTLVAWWAIRRMTAPLDEMARASDALAHGDFKQRVTRSASDELGRVAVAFNTMVDVIETQHRNLEGQVTERTADLEKALADLRTAQEELVRNARL